MKTIVIVLASALSGALLVIACSDDSPTPADADAGSCNCPAAEPPITMARLHRVDGGAVTAGLSATVVAGIACPAGELAIGGSCYIDSDETVREVSLAEAGLSSGGTGWECAYTNRSTVGTAMVRAQALCLRP